jgi:hypothetical protein
MQSISRNRVIYKRNKMKRQETNTAITDDPQVDP